MGKQAAVGKRRRDTDRKVGREKQKDRKQKAERQKAERQRAERQEDKSGKTERQKDKSRKTERQNDKSRKAHRAQCDTRRKEDIHGCGCTGAILDWGSLKCVRLQYDIFLPSRNQYTRHALDCKVPTK